MTPGRYMQKRGKNGVFVAICYSVVTCQKSKGCSSMSYNPFVVPRAGTTPYKIIQFIFLLICAYLCINSYYTVRYNG